MSQKRLVAFESIAAVASVEFAILPPVLQRSASDSDEAQDQAPDMDPVPQCVLRHKVVSAERCPTPKYNVRILLQRCERCNERRAVGGPWFELSRRLKEEGISKTSHRSGS